MNNNNNVGMNAPDPEKLKDDTHFDLTPSGGTDALGGGLGQFYTIAQLQAIAIANGATFRGDTPAPTALAAADSVVEVELDLKKIGGHGYTDGGTTKVTSLTSDAAYQNNGGWTDLDGGGGRQDGEDGITKLPTSVDQIWIANDSVATVHLTFQKA